MINVQVLSAEGIILVEPDDALEEEDFPRLEEMLRAYIEEMDRLEGLVIRTKSFPGWDDYSALKHHMKFVKEHHGKIQRVAIVTDSKLGEIAPALAKPIISAELKHFSYDRLDVAKQWIQKEV